MDGAVFTGKVVWEWEKGGAVLCAGDGVYRKEGSFALHDRGEGKIELTMVDGKVAGWVSTDKGKYNVATGTAAALAGKTWTAISRPAGSNQHDCQGCPWAGKPLIGMAGVRPRHGLIGLTCRTLRTEDHPMNDISDDAKRNRVGWTKANAEYTDKSARETWAAEEMAWGVYGIPEASLGTLGDVAGLDVIDLGCGTGYVSAWLARRGARPVGIDVTPAQLATARRCQQEFGIDFPLLEASAENVPLPSASFDLAVSEYGASIWCDPHLWLPEAHRLLRPGGRLWFLRNSTLSMLCATVERPPSETLQRPQRGLGRLEWPGEVTVEWQLPHGELFRLLRRTGFNVVDLVELYPPDDAVPHAYYDAYSVEWSRKWPCEEIWVAEKAR